MLSPEENRMLTAVGPISITSPARTTWRGKLKASSRREIMSISAKRPGIIMLRKLLAEQIAAVQKGEDPVGINRDRRYDTTIELIHEGYNGFSFAAARREQ